MMKTYVGNRYDFFSSKEEKTREKKEEKSKTIQKKKQQDGKIVLCLKTSKNIPQSRNKKKTLVN